VYHTRFSGVSSLLPLFLFSLSSSLFLILSLQRSKKRKRESLRALASNRLSLSLATAYRDWGTANTNNNHNQNNDNDNKTPSLSSSVSSLPPSEQNEKSGAQEVVIHLAGQPEYFAVNPTYLSALADVIVRKLCDELTLLETQGLSIF